MNKETTPQSRDLQRASIAISLIFYHSVVSLSSGRTGTVVTEGRNSGGSQAVLPVVLHCDALPTPCIHSGRKEALARRSDRCREQQYDNVSSPRRELAFLHFMRCLVPLLRYHLPFQIWLSPDWYAKRNTQVPGLSGSGGRIASTCGYAEATGLPAKL